MERIELFRVENVGGRRSRVISLDGKIVEVDGVRLEDQFQCSGGYLLITTDDVPFEEVVHFALLDPQLSLIDCLSLGQIYHPGIFKLLRFIDDDRFEFTFFGEEIWQFEILGKPVLRLMPAPFSAVKYRQGWLRKHHLKVRRVASGLDIATGERKRPGPITSADSGPH